MNNNIFFSFYFYFSFSFLLFIVVFISDLYSYLPPRVTIVVYVCVIPVSFLCSNNISKPCVYRNVSELL